MSKSLLPIKQRHDVLHKTKIVKKIAAVKDRRVDSLRAVMSRKKVKRWEGGVDEQLLMGMPG